MSLTELLHHAVLLAWPDEDDAAHQLARAAASRLLDRAGPRKLGLYQETMATLGSHLHKVAGPALKKVPASLPAPDGMHAASHRVHAAIGALITSLRGGTSRPLRAPQISLSCLGSSAAGCRRGASRWRPSHDEGSQVMHAVPPDEELLAAGSLERAQTLVCGWQNCQCMTADSARTGDGAQVLADPKIKGVKAFLSAPPCTGALIFHVDGGAGHLELDVFGILSQVRGPWPPPRTPAPYLQAMLCNCRPDRCYR